MQPDEHTRLRANRLAYEFRQIVRAAQVKAGLSHEQLARELELHPARLERVLEQPELLTMRGIARIAEVLNVEVAVVERYG